MIGSIIGVGIANQLMSARTGTSGVDWGQATNIGKSLLLSPIVGFVVRRALLWLMKAVIKNQALCTRRRRRLSRRHSGFDPCSS